MYFGQDIELLKWQNDLHEQCTRMHSAITALTALLVDKGVATGEEIKEYSAECLAQDKYQTILNDIQASRAQYERHEEPDLGDIFASFFGGNNEQKK